MILPGGSERKPHDGDDVGNGCAVLDCQVELDLEEPVLGDADGDDDGDDDDEDGVDDDVDGDGDGDDDHSAVIRCSVRR